MEDGGFSFIPNLIFSGMSGTALADVGGLGRIEIAAMRKRVFFAPFAGAVTVASAVAGPIFPPGIPLIVYGSVTSVSIVQLLLAGIVPALICINDREEPSLGNGTLSCECRQPANLARA